MAMPMKLVDGANGQAMVAQQSWWCIAIMPGFAECCTTTDNSLSLWCSSFGWLGIKTLHMVGSGDPPLWCGFAEMVHDGNADEAG